MTMADIINKLEVDYMRIDNGPKECRLFYDKKYLLSATKGGGYWELIHDLLDLKEPNE